ncbi:MAG: flavin reductase [Rhizobiaceae bacterium]|nr:flavin reductase [Rhizobiaceae bacterium]
MSRFAAAVHLVTSDGPAGRRGVTATSVCSVSDSPATILVCLNTSSVANLKFEANGCFAVNLLSSRDEALSRAFAGEGDLSPEERFACGGFEPLATGAPVLATALAAFDCRLVETRIVATHHVMIGEVAGLRLGDPGDALIYRDRGYLHL